MYANYLQAEVYTSVQSISFRFRKLGWCFNISVLAERRRISLMLCVLCPAQPIASDCAFKTGTSAGSIRTFLFAVFVCVFINTNILLFSCICKIFFTFFRLPRLSTRSAVDGLSDSLCPCARPAGRDRPGRRVTASARH